MNGDLINRDVVLSVLKERYCEGCTYYGVRCKSVLSGNCPIYNAIIAVGAVPAVDAEPVRHTDVVMDDAAMMIMDLLDRVSKLEEQLKSKFE